MTNPAREKGFALVATLLLLLVLTLLAVRLDARVAVAREMTAGWLELADAELRLISARNELLYLMLTVPLSYQGFSDGVQNLRPDGRIYVREDGVRLSIQDMRGLISIATPPSAVLSNFLRQAGIGDREVGPLLEKLADYADTDDLKRLNGAERKEYAAAGLFPPRNEWPLSAWELGRVMGWHAHDELWIRAGDFFTAVREEWINPNTAPREVLLALPGATPKGVEAILKRRERQPFRHEAEMASVAGLALPADEPTQFLPGWVYRIRLWAPPAPRAQEWVVMLTPMDENPWLVLERRTIASAALAEGQGAAFPLWPLTRDHTGHTEAGTRAGWH